MHSRIVLLPSAGTLTATRDNQQSVEVFDVMLLRRMRRDALLRSMLNKDKEGVTPACTIFGDLIGLMSVLG